MEKRINITCNCGKVHDVPRTSEIPDNVISMGCNWCPVCEDTAKDYYDEWYNENEDGNSSSNDVPDNQMCLPIELNEMEFNKPKVLTETT